MNRPVIPNNRRVLVVDDTLSIHGDFKKILGQPDPDSVALLEAQASFLGQPAPVFFEIDGATQGEEGVKKVQESLTLQLPYALAFIDMRMPPGMDGLKTMQKVSELDDSIQIVLCTAFSDYSWDELRENLNLRDRLLILKKPFETVEVLQLAYALTEKWRLYRETQRTLEELEKEVVDRTAKLTAALEEVKALAGLLPICAYCHKVREGQEYWTSVETYMAKHLSTKFSHGVCPDCQKKFLDPSLEKFLNDVAEEKHHQEAENQEFLDKQIPVEPVSAVQGWTKNEQH